MEFEIMNEGSDSFEKELSELDQVVELQTPTLRRSDHVRRPVERYSPPDFCSAFVLFAINDEPRSVKEAINSQEGKLQKKDMIEEMEALEKNEAQDLL